MNEIYTRVSIRKYQDRPVEREKLMQILKAGMQAPSAGNQQPWEFYVVEDKETIETLSKVHRYSGCAAAAPVVIVPCIKTDNMIFEQYGDIDCAIATENMWLEMTSLGLGGVWMGISPVEDRMRAVEEILHMPENLKAFALLPLGYPAETKQQQDRFHEERIHFV